MSTNFYAYDKEIDKSIKEMEKKTGIKITIEGYPYHLGKSIYLGFILQYPEHSEYNDWKSMKKWLKNKTIKDEYNRKVKYDDFVKLVEESSKNNKIKVDNPYTFVVNNYIFSEGDFC